MRRLLKRIYLYFKGKEIWDAKMSEHLEITIVSTPKTGGKFRRKCMIFTEEDVNCNFVCASTNACVNNAQG